MLFMYSRHIFLIVYKVRNQCRKLNEEEKKKRIILKKKYKYSESAKYSKHLINRVLHGAPIIEVIFLREEKPVLAFLMLSAKQGSHWYHF